MNKQAGQTLVEVLVIAALVTIILVALVAAISRSIANNQTSNDQVTATTLSQEPVEWLRYWREVVGWKQLMEMLTLTEGANKTWCLPVLYKEEAEFANLVEGECDPGQVINELYLREVNAQLSSNKLTLKIKVYWSGVRGDKEVVVTQELYDWK